jgi:hypothetical protein
MKEKILLCLLLILAFACKKENKAIQSLRSNNYFDPNPPISIEFVPGSKEEVMTADKSWEKRILNYFSIVRKDNDWQMWYEAFDENAIHDDLSNLCYAYSKDGKNWIKPDFSYYRLNNKGTNILIKGAFNKGIHAPFVFKNTNANQPYLMTALSFNLDNGTASLYGYTSNDGLKWKNKRIVSHDHLDTQNSFTQVGSTLTFFTRFWTGLTASNGFRAIGRMQTDTSWNMLQENKILLTADPTTEYKHIYNNAMCKISDSLYLFFPSQYNDSNLELRVSLAYGKSTDKIYFINNDVTESLTQGTPYKSIYVVPGAFTTGEPDTYWIYYFATNFKHGQSGSANLSSYYRVKFKIKYK